MTAGAYGQVERSFAADRCLVLDGGVATELQRRGVLPLPGEDIWGSWALHRAPEAILDVHRSYVEAGCGVLSTHTWAILADAVSPPPLPVGAGPTHWMDAARLAVGLARTATREAGRGEDCAVAFSLSGETAALERSDLLQLLDRIFTDEPPDILLVETLSLIREDETFALVERLLALGLPVWLSFRRCRHGVCGVYGQHWGPPEGDLFGRAARRFEELGVSALLVNCLPVEHVPGMLGWLADYTDLPLGVYPNLGHLTRDLWRFDERIAPADYAALALAWREEGARIVGGCCGVTPAHIAAAAGALDGTKPGTRRFEPVSEPPLSQRHVSVAPWLDGRDRPLFPLPFPELTVEPGVFVPTQGSYLLWKYLHRAGAGRGERCLDVGCGCGILSIQLALNGAASVLAMDIDRRSVANTLANAFRNGVDGLVEGEAIDLYQWEPRQRFDLIAASLYQMPVDPYEEPTGHRPLDYWGRNLFDRFLALLPELLSEGGRGLVMQLSILGRKRTAELLAAQGLSARVLDYGFFPFGPLFERNIEQVARVEERSDAYHLAVGGDNVMVAYLLEVTRAGASQRAVR